MGRFGMIGSAYRSQSVLADSQTLINWYEEQIESGVGRSAAALYPTPGLSAALYNLGAAGMRGETTLQGRTFSVQGTTLWELLPPNANPNKINRGTVVSDGNPVSFAGGGYQLLLASAGLAYVFNLQTNGFAQVDPSAGANLPIAFVAFCDSFFFAIVENAATPWQINSSNPLDATTWQATNFTTVQSFQDNPICLFENQNILWVFSLRKIQPYSNTGNFPFPFDRIPGTLIENGIAAPFSVVKLDNSLFWLGSDDRGNGVVWRANGFRPQRVSDHALEFALQGYGNISDAVAYSYQDQGHSFYVLSLPSANKTWIYDVATGKWSQRGFWNAQKGQFDRQRQSFHTFNFGMHLVGDYSTGAVYQMAVNIGSDFGNPIVRERTSPHINKELEYIFIERVQADVEVGLVTLQGNAAATTITLADATGALWSVQVNDQGIFVVTPGSIGNPQTLYLNDPVANSTWQIVVQPIDAAHATLQPVAVAPFDAIYAPAFPMVSQTGNTQWAFTVRQLAPAIAQLVLTPQGIVGRGPLWTLQWSRDGGQTFSQGQQRESGQLGQFTKRVLWNRLGRARDWVFRLRYSEVAPARVIDFYARSADYTPSERLVKEAVKRA